MSKGSVFAQARADVFINTDSNSYNTYANQIIPNNFQEQTNGGVQIYETPGGTYLLFFPNGQIVDSAATDLGSAYNDAATYHQAADGSWSQNTSSSPTDQSTATITPTGQGSTVVPTTNPGSLGNDCGPSTSLKGVVTGNAINGGSLICDVAYGVGTILLRISAFFMWLAATLFNFVISYTIVNITTNLSHLGVITTAWTAFRDLANIFFIFILLYIAIATILQLETVNTKKVLTSLVVVALLINFSLFFTQIIIDGSNIFALTFLSKITVNGQNLDNQANSTSFTNNGLANAFLAPIGIGSLFGPPSTVSPGNLPAFTKDSYGSVLLIAIFSSVVMFVLVFVFAVMSVLFLTRYVVLIFIMILSPLAFAGMILPKTKGMISDEWWKTLFDQALFPPIFFILMWVVVAIISSKTFVNSQDLSGWGGLFSNGSGGGINLVFNFAVIIAMLVASIIISKKSASSGGKAVASAVNVGTSAMGGFVGRSIVRGTGLGVLDDKFKNSRFGNTYFGSGLRNITTGAATNAKFFGSQSVVEKNKDTKERKAKLNAVENRQRLEALARNPSTSPTEISRAVRDMGNEVTNLPASLLKNDAVVKHLTPSQLKAIDRTTDKFSDKDKNAIKQARIKPLTEAINDKTGTKNVESALGELHPSEIADLPLGVLKDSKVSKHLTVSMLSKIQETVSKTDRIDIRNAITAATYAKGTPGFAAQMWLRNPKGGIDF